MGGGPPHAYRGHRRRRLQRRELGQAAQATPGIDVVRVLDDLSSGSLDNVVGVDVTFREGTIMDPRPWIGLRGRRRGRAPGGALVPRSLAGRLLPLLGHRLQTRDFTFVASVTSVITGAVLRPVGSGRPVNLAFGARTSLRELIQSVKCSSGSPRSTPCQGVPATCLTRRWTTGCSGRFSPTLRPRTPGQPAGDRVMARD